MYVIRSNAKNDLYLSFTNKTYFYDRRIDISQNTIDFAFYFTDQIYAEQFLEKYFEKLGDKIKESNKKYYKVIAVDNKEATENIFMFGLPCYFSMKKFNCWRENPAKYDIHI